MNYFDELKIFRWTINLKWDEE